MIYFTSDFHFAHKKPFLFEPRGFSNVEDMNRTIIENLESNMINLTSQITSLNGRIGKNDVRDTENEF